MNEFIHISFNKCRIYIRAGGLNFLCYFFAAYTMWYGFVPLMS